jgi:DNA replication protein DnaC
MFFPVDEKKVEEYEKQQADIQRQKAQERYEQSGVPMKFFNESIETFSAETETEKKVVENIICYADNPADRILILYGNNGTGKTHLACGVIRKYGGRYITSSLFCIKYESATSYKAKQSREEILAGYTECKLLVIDECGKYTLNNDTERFLLSYIISTRYENGLPTIVITNGTKDAFISFLGKAVYDRLTEVCTTIQFNWESRRKKRRK